MGNYVANRKLVDQKMEKVQEDFTVTAVVVKQWWLSLFMVFTPSYFLKGGGTTLPSRLTPNIGRFIIPYFLMINRKCEGT